MWAGSYARDEHETAEKVAGRDNGAALAQTAEGQAALTRLLEDKAR